MCIGNLTSFQHVDSFLSYADLNRTPVKSIIVGHLTNLIQDFHSYFPYLEKKYAQIDWDKLLEVSSDLSLQLKFAKSTLTQFWVSVKQDYPYLGQRALEQLLPFASTYLFEASFSAMNVVGEKKNGSKRPHQIGNPDELEHNRIMRTLEGKEREKDGRDTESREGN
ncbi:unnamed protein product [Lepeophtheirus salmonis]|uniref:(salmon louse) hypothetical protein n=1 Tax=Lepeophtheirus salmonis TaxID=72036 RepID=A0A7R8CNC6_LEPSM|nr:unnamed protein product [Lepeophtheirus salmonis]CAF2844910.1 unnamed protein product [Lepeophtheirus salmonis]